MSNQHVVCIHHAKCLDGIAAAWVVWDYYKKQGIEVELIPANYTQGLPCGLEGKKVYVVDFSYDYPTMEWLLNNTDLVLLDHHDTAVRRLDNLKLNALLTMASAVGSGIVTEHLRKAAKDDFKDIILDNNHSGAMLAWKHFYGDKAPPYGIRFVEDRDLWKFEYGENTKLWTTAAFSYPFTVENFHELVEAPIPGIIAEGRTLRRKYEQDLNAIALNARPMIFMGHQVPVVNAPYIYASELGGQLAKGNRFAVIYEDLENCRKFSLRSIKGKGEHVGKIAELFGGGGHENAAGFVIPFKDRRMAKSHLKLDITFWQKVKRLFGRV